ncbi:MAG: mercuric transporter MerT family protein [Gemmatimonadaceae bacterium]
MLTSVGAVGAAALASLCCIGPVLFLTLGVGAGLAARFEPVRPVFTILSVGLLAGGFRAVYWRAPATEYDAACAATGSCAVPRRGTRDKVVLWVATVVVLALLTFPQWSKLLV